ncbi:hypothetical protein [Wenjunlia vitaminophila]|uniref:hypothetical protein n=1 Tax=Wenjunlia vitaminophila TaxID=76728 RepID=UPI001FD20BFE|nr:hypothetical protein [Wenjunlia vitaminophila]
MHWDAVRVPDPAVADAVLDRLGRETGSVIADGRTGVAYWLVRPQAADSWPAMPRVSVLARDDFVAVPPIWMLQGTGPHWRVPFLADSYLTPPDHLCAALLAATAHLQEEDDAPLVGLAAERQAWREQGQRIRSRLREVNRRSITRESRPWG